MINKFLKSIKNDNISSYRSFSTLVGYNTLQQKYILDFLKKDGSNSYLLCPVKKSKIDFNTDKKNNFNEYLAGDQIVFVKDCQHHFSLISALSEKIKETLEQNTKSDLFTSNFKSGYKKIKFENTQGSIITNPLGIYEINILGDKVENIIVPKASLLYIPKNVKYEIGFVTQSIVFVTSFISQNTNNTKTNKKNIIENYSEAIVKTNQNNIIKHVPDYVCKIQELTKKKNQTVDEVMNIVSVYSLFRNPFQTLNYMDLLDFKKSNFKEYDKYSQLQVIDKDYKCIEYFKKDVKNNVPISFLADKYLTTLISEEEYDSALWLLEKQNLIGNWNYEKTDSLYLKLNWPKYSCEFGLIFVHLHLLTYLIRKYELKKLYIQCHETFKEFFSLYFPEIVIVDEEDVINKVPYISIYKAFIDFHKQDNVQELIKEQIVENRKCVEHKLNRKSDKVGLLWFSNDIIMPNKTIPIGVFINTIGNNKKTLNLKSLQYNMTEYDVQVFNKYSKNKIKETFDSDFHTPIIDIVHEVFDCKAVIGTSTVILIAGAFGIPTLITAASPHFHWYLKQHITPTIKTSRMNFWGDWQTVYDDIHKFIDANFD